jgi:vitamin B12 transporter
MRPSQRRSVPVLLFLCAYSLLTPVAPAHAQATVSVPGVVVDEVGAIVAGARVTVSDASGVVVQTVTSGTTGTFSLHGLVPGAYALLVELNLFLPSTERVTVPASGSPAPVRVVLKAGGFTESVVVTARRVETRMAETPQRIEVIDATDIERTVAADLTDLLKKNAGVDVIQYTGALSGVGIRGFRPQIAGINKRSLLLVDGRPSGVTNLATLLLDNADRIEVLKGAASSVYGSSAMGGVINVITRQSHGQVGGHARIGIGSFGVTEVVARAGGSASSRVDFDASGSLFEQRDDIRMGNGVTRPATSFKTYAGTGRVAAGVSGDWRIEGRGDVYRGRDINTPPDVAAGTIGQGRKNIERSGGDVRVTGRVSAHALSVSTYLATEASHNSNVTTSNPADEPYLPYLSFESDLRWAGVQARDSWNWSRLNSVVFGLDYEKVTSVSRSYTRTGDRSAPFSADSHKRTAGFYVENTLRLRGGRTVVAAGGRVDHITTETVGTPLKTNFTPSETTFTVFNPSIGIKHELVAGLRAHFTAGRAFIPAEALMLTGFTTTIVGGRTQISQGNPDLDPERSTSFDVGVEWTSGTTRFDATVFRTVVKDRFITNVVISNPPAPDPIVVSVRNGLDAHISGLELEAEQRLGRSVGVFANTAHYFNRKERLTSGLEQDILNVPVHTVRAGVDVDFGHLSARLSGRFVQGRQDNDFNQPGFPIVDYDDFMVADATVTYRLRPQHTVVAAINNLFDTFYYEKIGYPLQGASFKLSYRLGF